jgi:excisionase family DNA binding protein
MEDPRILTAKETAAYLRIPVKTLADWRLKGKGPSYFKAGNHVRYLRAVVDRWIEANTQGANQSS